MVARLLSGMDRKTFEGTLQADNIAPLNVHFIHIPKTAGDSAMLDSPNFLLKGQTLKGNDEMPYKTTKQRQHLKAPNNMAFVLLRKPINHVLSQFMECKYDIWGKKVTKGTGFPGYDALDNPLEGFDEWVAHFAENPDAYGPRGEKWAHAPYAYKCYDPWNMQARKLTMKSGQRGHYCQEPSDRFPPLQQVRATLQEPELILGITEHYSASMCLLEYHALQGGALTEACRTCNFLTHSLPMVEARQHHNSHNVPYHSVDMITNQTTLQYIQRITAIDRLLYDYALGLFQDKIQKVHNATGVDLLCRGEKEGERALLESQVKGSRTSTKTLTKYDVGSDVMTHEPGPTIGITDDAHTAAFAALQQPKIALSISPATESSAILLIMGSGLLLVIRWCFVRLKLEFSPQEQYNVQSEAYSSYRKEDAHHDFRHLHGV